MAKVSNANDHAAHENVACGGSSPHHVHASKVQAAACQVCTLATNADMEDDGGSNNTSQSVGVGNGSGKSPNSTLQMVEILRSFGVSKPGNLKFVCTGDMTQLPAFSQSRWHTFPFMRFPSVSGSPLLLEELWWQRSAFIALSICMFDEGLVTYTEKVPMSYLSSILHVIWLRELLQQHCFSAPVETSLATPLFRGLVLDPYEDTIITFNNARCQLVSSLFPYSACKIVNGCQGPVVEGCMDGAAYLIFELSAV